MNIPISRDLHTPKGIVHASEAKTESPRRLVEMNRIHSVLFLVEVSPGVMAK
jgi:hypothetical protein